MGPLADFSTAGGKWMPDSRRWIELTDRVRPVFTIHDLGSPKSKREVPVAGFETNLRRKGDRMHLFFGGAVQGARLLGVTPGQRALLQIFPAQEDDRVHIADVGLAPNSRPPMTFSIRFPRKSTIKEVATSPRGDRIAWLLSVADRSPDGKASAKVELWTCLSDGSDLELIGEASPDGHNGPWDGCDAAVPNRIRWIPGSRDISFVCRNGLYAVTAR
ncbi:MAG TPA: hypothetical protein VKT77_12675 [Chthonomonadaceae bacterium]|nr:hypothetical protein [Chthonomonadaceae bacterium]